MPDTFTRSVVRALLWTVLAGPAAVLVVVGALAGGWPVLTWGATLALAGALGSAALNRSCGDVLSPLPHPAVAAAAAGVLPAVQAGAMALGTTGGLLVLPLVVAGSVAFSLWLPTVPPGAPLARAEGSRAAALTDPELRRVLRAAPTAQLLGEWRALQEQVDAGGPPSLEEVRVRDALIDELAARDPAGTARWLTEDPAGLPERHIGREPRAGG